MPCLRQKCCRTLLQVWGERVPELLSLRVSGCSSSSLMIVPWNRLALHCAILVGPKTSIKQNEGFRNQSAVAKAPRLPFVLLLSPCLLSSRQTLCTIIHCVMKTDNHHLSHSLVGTESKIYSLSHLSRQSLDKYVKILWCSISNSCWGVYGMALKMALLAICWWWRGGCLWGFQVQVQETPFILLLWDESISLLLK